jgi:hypothetical protein
MLISDAADASNLSAAAAADLVKTTSEGIQSGFKTVIEKLSETVSFLASQLQLVM